MTKHGTQVALKLLPNVVVDSIDETFPHRLLLTNTQVLEIWTAFVNDSSANIKLSKTQLFKTLQLEGFTLHLLSFALELEGKSNFWWRSDSTWLSEKRAVFS